MRVNGPYTMLLYARHTCATSGHTRITRRGQVGAAEDEVSTRLCLEGEDLGRHHIGDAGRVPLGPLQSAA